MIGEDEGGGARQTRVPGRLVGKVAIVTGAGRGIGRAIALTLAGDGTAIVVVARTQNEAEETAASILSLGSRSLAVVADVCDWRSMQGMVDRVVESFGGIHILVNNAGVQGPIGPLVDNDPDEWLRTVQTNLMGTFYCCKAVLPHMIKARCGKIVNLSGGGATSPRPNFSAYSATKSAIVRLTETLAEELKDYGIQVNAVAPGAVNTRMLEEVIAAGSAAGEQAIADAQRQLESGGTSPEIVAALVQYLSSDDSNGLTGKLVAAIHDDWQNWDAARLAVLMSSPWLALRRVDPFTIGQLTSKLGRDGK